MKTKIISVAGEKGGVGKTTLNIMLATNLFHTYGKKVVLLDVDNPQFSIFKKRQRELDLIGENEEDNIPIYPIIRVTVRTIKDKILQHYGKVDYIIIDFPGSLSLEMVQGLMFVEHIFIPFDHDELLETVERDAAGDRLQKALDQLQKTIDGLLNKVDRELSGSVGELDTLRGEREQVGATLAELEQKYEDLRAVAKVVSGRLSKR
ncbi:AAA family ATPase [Croceibacter atlanticus]|uniref:AAA family ATPase n=1 Tax=Croceibacter atlanticus TaxID=313588 RepID=UPI0032B20B7B